MQYTMHRIYSLHSQDIAGKVSSDSDKQFLSY